MSDLISRQAVINAIANTCFWLSADNWEELTKCINSIPSADIIDHARAIKEYCEKERINCAECPFYNRERNLSCVLCDPCMSWDLPEGEKKSCNTCKNNDDEFSGECYECVKNIQNHYEPEGEVKPNE